MIVIPQFFYKHFYIKIGMKFNNLSQSIFMMKKIKVYNKILLSIGVMGGNTLTVLAVTSNPGCPPVNVRDVS